MSLHVSIKHKNNSILILFSNYATAISHQTVDIRRSQSFQTFTEITFKSPICVGKDLYFSNFQAKQGKEDFNFLTLDIDAINI